MLSILIVNYNVKYFLEQCLCSVEKSLCEYPRAFEILVVDNDSRDGSLDYLKPRFPAVHFIANTGNTGFARANNLALAKSRGDYILFLNPDTILAEDSLEKSIAWLEVQDTAGAAGFCMVDGKGHFLPESRRGFPSPWVSFCKLSGLTALFPDSKRFAGYYLGGSDNTINGPAPILSGAGMLVKKQALDRTGGFDERFFMYAEDIDLSHRIGLAGYTNYYIAEAAMLHFKGESTQKDARYVKLFYKAMSQFSHKYFRDGGGAVFTLLMDLAIGCRGMASAVLQVFRKKNKPIQRDKAPIVYVTGDPTEAALLKEKFAAKETAKSSIGEMATLKNIGVEMEITEDPVRADEILFCEGPGFSFKMIIAAMRANPGRHYLLHASGSNSIVGSGSCNGGTIIG